MTYDESEKTRGERFLPRPMIVWVVAPVIAGLIGILLLVLVNSPTGTTHRTGGPEQIEESGLESARQSLTRQTDLDTCRGALGQINSELSEKPQLSAPPLKPEQRDWLRQHAGLTDEEFAEVEATNYTQLDGQHLDRCFLMRDAAAGLEVRGVRTEAGGAPVQETGLERAERAFAWVMRQVRLREHGGEVVPPAFALRRGWGKALERALVFLTLLEQIGDSAAASPELLGCMLSVPDKAGRTRFWACGVLVGEGKDVYLFDPRLGMPLPGPKGKGIATLAQACQQPDIFTQLQAGKYRYDVTMEEARQAQARFFCSLSSLSPRMRQLQDHLLPPVVRIRLAADPARALERLKAAGVSKVELSKASIGLLRRFLTPDEGGVDKGVPMAFAELGGFTSPDDTEQRMVPRRQRFLWQLVPWSALPRQFADKNRFPYHIEMGMRIRQTFAGPFIMSAMDPGHARDLLLRGHYSKASEELVSERDRWRIQQQRGSNVAELEPQIDAWVKNAFSEYADLRRAKSPEERQAVEQRIRNLWSDKQAAPVYQLLFHAVAEARIPEINYMLGLYSQEQAEQLQGRLDLQTRASKSPPTKSELQRAKGYWQNAASTWKQYIEDYPQRGDVAAARRMRSRAEVMLGDRKTAAAVLKDLSGEMTEMEKLAALYRAGQTEQK